MPRLKLFRSPEVLRRQKTVRSDLSSPENFAALVGEHQTAVFRTLTRLTGSGPHVEDLAQEAFLRLFRALPEFRGDATVSTYLYRIVYNLAQDEWKRRRKERAHIAQGPVREEEDEAAGWIENVAGDPLTEHARTPEQRLADMTLARAVEQELARLPPLERAALVLFHQEELSYEGVAAALGLPLNTVRTHIHRGRKRLSERLRERMGAGRAVVQMAKAPERARPAPAGGNA